MIRCWFWTYCNATLLTAFAEMRISKPSTHARYVKTRWWKILSSAAKRRAGYACQLCNNKKVPLHTHHRCYARKGTFKEYRDLIVLCETCHTKFHKEVINASRRKPKQK